MADPILRFHNTPLRPAQGAPLPSLLTPSPPPPPGPPVWATAGGVAALPEVNPQRPPADTLALISWRERASLVLRAGTPGEPFLSATLLEDHHSNRLFVPFNTSLDDQWIPSYHYEGGVSVRLLCPLTEDPREAMGFGLLVTGGQGQVLEIRLRWGVTDRVVFRPRPAPGPENPFWCPWTGSWRMDGPGVGLALRAGSAQDGFWARQDGQVCLTVRLRLNGPLTWVPIGVGEQSEAASLAAMHLARLGGAALQSATRQQLDRIHPPAQTQEEETIRRHALFGRLYTSAFCVDRNEEVLLTSRSPRYYVSGAFWCRDACWWTLPATTRQCPATARRHLELVFTRYGENAARHALWLDGSVLYDGFELDQLCYPLLAAEDYAHHTGDDSLWAEPWIAAHARRFLHVLSRQRDPQCGFYRTFLNASDDMLPGGISLMANVLVHKTLMICSRHLGLPAPVDATRFRQALLSRFTVPQARGSVLGEVLFQGRAVAGDNPALSLLLLPFLGFLNARHPLMRRTAAWVTGARNPFHTAGEFRGEGNIHGGGAWTMGLAARVLSGLDAAHGRRALLGAVMDGGDACEAVDPHTGGCHSGAAMASAAAFITQAFYADRGGCATRPAVVQGGTTCPSRKS